jgi:hypothetical protein
MSGGRPDGQPWPAVGEMLDCTEEEGAELIASGVAVPPGTRGEPDPLAGREFPDRSVRVIEPDGTGDPSAPRPGVLADGTADPAVVAQDAVKPDPAPAPADAPAPPAEQNAPIAGTPQAKARPSAATSPARVAKPASGSK